MERCKIWAHCNYSFNVHPHQYPIFLHPEFLSRSIVSGSYSDCRLESKQATFHFFYFFEIILSMAFFFILFISWRLITLQYCSGFCHTLTCISHGVTCIPHPDPPSHLPLHLIPLGLPSAPGPNTCLMHPTWAGDLFHPR